MSIGHLGTKIETRAEAERDQLRLKLLGLQEVHVWKTNGKVTVRDEDAGIARWALMSLRSGNFGDWEEESPEEWTENIIQETLNELSVKEGDPQPA